LPEKDRGKNMGLIVNEPEPVSEPVIFTNIYQKDGLGYGLGLVHD
jgi:hypothetical protein